MSSSPMGFLHSRGSVFEPPGRWEQALSERVRGVFRHSNPEIVFLDSHRADHRLARIATDGSEYFLKAFDPAGELDFRIEAGLYRQLVGTGLAPRAVHVDEGMRFLITTAGTSTRLRDLDASQVRPHLSRIPELYAALIGFTSPQPACDHRTKIEKHYAAIAHHRVAGDLPAPEEVIAVLTGMPELLVHGDFQPTNILVDQDTVIVVDFESYGLGLAAVDVARLAFNPFLAIDEGERTELAVDLLDRVAADVGVPTSFRQLTAAIVYWAVACADYFTGVVAGESGDRAWLSDAAVLASRPLELAAEIWNKEG